MIVFLVGGPGRLADLFIAKLNKEGHRVFLLTGEEHKEKEYHGKVFASFSFHYDNINMPEIFQSVNPDVVLYLGAFDSRFHSGDENEIATKYTGGLVMLLSCFHNLQHGKFIYLSTSRVFEKGSMENITEDMNPEGKNTKTLSLIMAEQLVLNFASSGDDCSVLRLDELSLVPLNLSDIDDPSTKMCLDAFNHKTLSYSENKSFSLLSESDAVEFVYRYIAQKKHEFNLYNISSSKEISEEELCKKVAVFAEAEVSDVENVPLSEYESEKFRHVLSNTRYDSEFGMRFKVTEDQMIEKILKQMEKHKKTFREKASQNKNAFTKFFEKLKWLFMLAVPYIENIVVFILVFFAANYWLSDKYFGRLDIYLLYILLFAVIYGQQQAIVSGVLSVVGFLIAELQIRTGFEIMADYNTYVWMAQLFIVGLVVGYLRDRIKKQKEETTEEETFLTKRIADIQSINSSNIRVKDALEVQLVNQVDSVGKIYNITSKLNKYTPEETLFYAAEVFMQMMETKDVAIYMCSDSAYARLFTATSEKARSIGNSIRFADQPEIEETIRAGKVYINRRLEKDLPMMASGVFSEEKGLIALVFVWGIPWEKMTLGEANLMSVTSMLVRDSFVRAERFLSQMEFRKNTENTHVMDVEAFSNSLQAFSQAKSKHLTDFKVVSVLESEEFTDEDYEKLDSLLRETDRIGYLEDGRLAAILANTTDASLPAVLSRLENAGFICSDITKEV